MRNSIYLFLLITGMLLGCTQSNTENKIKHTHIVVDDMGRKIDLPISPTRIISLTPSISELLYTFIDSSRIVGRSAWCDYPEGIKTKPVINSYPVDIEALVRLKPDLILVKKGMISIQDLEKLEQLHQTVFVQEYDLMKDIRKSATTLVQLTKGDTLQLNQWLVRLKNNSSAIKNTKKFLAITSVNPVYVYGKKTFLSELAEFAGGENCVQLIDNPYPTIDVEYMLRSNPEVYIFDSEAQKALFFETYPILKKTIGFQESKLYVIDASVMSRPGIRLPILKDSITAIMNR
ncbi:helical backbone metal receptor [uncultured Cytophaga sp.]|uniref:helical backbone metal receptor n=1 Tax=uncultured Cytophaga sp. TaxID=160238 RepID=UPI002634F215|nr:helical backbone metal receptor [uncultured Cytophaga sp.]